MKMTTAKYLDDEVLVKKGIKALIDSLGPIEANRFILMPQKKRMESVKRHRVSQKALDKDDFLKKVFG